MKLPNLLLSLLFLTTLGQAKELIEEKSLIKGTLENGFKYTIKKNKKPKDTAIFRLIVKVGSLEEDDDQKGIAHMVEHMAFNGTKHFKGNDLIKFLESIGSGFGSHINASTSTSNTIYKLTIPIKNDNLEKAMLVFSDWAGGINFTKKELDKERGIILEEARVRNNINFRLYLKSKDIIYEGTKYKDRTPIGDLDIIKNVPLHKVKAFYDDWYRPEFMHFIAVGDFDEKKIEKLIKNTFSTLKNKSNKKRVSRGIPIKNRTKVILLKDKEIRSSKLNLNFIGKIQKVKTEEDYKKMLIKNIALRLFNEKVTTQILKKNSFAKSIRLNSRKLGSNQDIYSFSAKFIETKEIEALKELISIIYNINHFGFEEDEFNRLIKQKKKSTKELSRSIKNKESSLYMHLLSAYILTNNTFIDEEYAIDLKLKLLNEITLEEINNFYKEILKYKNRIILYQLEKNAHISKEEVKKILNEAKYTKKEKIKKNILPISIIPKNLKEIKIKKEKYNKKYDFYEFVLDNDIKVIYKYNNYDKNVVNLNAYSKGGFSLYENNKLGNAKYTSKIILNSGFDKYNILDIKKIYSDKNIQVSTNIKRYAEIINGFSSTKDFKYLIENIYLLTKKYRVDENILYNTKMMRIESLKKEENNPSIKFNNELLSFIYNKNKRFRRLTKEDILNINKQDILNIYKDRFRDMNNFTFIIVGDIEKKFVKKYIQKYFGNIPTLKREETYKFRNIKPIKGKQKFIRNYNNENISSISLTYTNETTYSIEEAINLYALRDILKTKLREYIREEKSGVYKISVIAKLQREPYSKKTISISFNCDPKRKEELINEIKKVITKLMKSPVEKRYVSNIVKRNLLILKEGKQKNKFWIRQLLKHYSYGDSLENIEKYEYFYKKITPQQIMKTAKKYFNTNNILHTELNPKKMSSLE